MFSEDEKRVPEHAHAQVNERIVFFFFFLLNL